MCGIVVSSIRYRGPDTLYNKMTGVNRLWTPTPLAKLKLTQPRVKGDHLWTPTPLVKLKLTERVKGDIDIY